MIVYRLADNRFVEDREGIGAKMFGGRWNKADIPCIYASSHISLAFLEKFVHANAKESMQNLALLEIEIPTKNLVFEVDRAQLQVDWLENINYTQWFGSQILEELSIVVFSIPSAIIPFERNYVLNPRALDFDKIKYNKIIDFSTDFRLLNRLL